MISTDVDRATYVLWLADDVLVLSHRLAEWITRAPELEEDVALANIGLDLLGQARSLYTYAGTLDGTGRDEDELAYFRDERHWRNLQLVELENGDFAISIARLLVFSAYECELYDRLSSSADETLAAVAAKSLKEALYHRDHATQWTLRLGDGTEESRVRMQAGLDLIWPYVEELFEGEEVLEDLVREEVAVDPATLRAPVLGYVADVVGQATLTTPETRVRHSGGRRGLHTEQMGYLLAEMQHLARSHPEATW